MPPKFVKIRPNTTELQILSQTIAIAIRHKLTYEATLSIFKLIKSITSNSNLPSIKKSLWRALLRNDDLATVRHFFVVFANLIWALKINRIKIVNAKHVALINRKNRLRISFNYTGAPIVGIAR